MQASPPPPSLNTLPAAPDRAYAPPVFAPPPGLGGSVAPQKEGVAWYRYVSAVKRSKLLIAIVIALGTAAGFAVARMQKPEYRVQATIWISNESPERQSRGPIRADELLYSSSWLELFRSGAIVDPVVRSMRLYLNVPAERDVPVFADFQLADKFQPGQYQLVVGPEGGEYALMTKEGRWIEDGAAGDSIGRQLGFRWAPKSEVLGVDRVIAFEVITPREATFGLTEKVGATIPRSPDGRASNFMRVWLTGHESAKTAAILNGWVAEFLDAAGRLKKRNLIEFARILREQLDYAKRQLDAAEIALESFRVNTITQPSEGVPVAGGLEETRDPVFNNFFNQRVQFDELRRDREALERIVAEARSGRVTAEAFLSVPSVLASSEGLRDALSELNAKEAQLRSARQLYTDEHKMVKDLDQAVQSLRTNTIPELGTALLTQLQLREADLDRRLKSSSSELRAIPARTIEEMRLRRNVTVAENLYTSLQSRFEEARLAEASAVPDVQLLDSAVAPQRPTNDAAIRIILMAIVGSIGVSLALAILLDRVDPRVRYPDQVTHELGLEVLGAIPTIKQNEKETARFATATQVVEAFRTVRLTLTHALQAAPPIVVTVTSPSPGDGKSLVSSNLALSFADAGYRTLLVDGDVRRGQVHECFGIERRPGLVECLAGASTPEEVLRPVAHSNLTVMPSGARRSQAPELLASQGMVKLIEHLKGSYDAIIIDSAPLSAGIDPYALAAVAGRVILVMKTGVTDRRTTQAKLGLMDRMPVEIVGAVLNDYRAEGAYRYYTYLDEYSLESDEDAGETPLIAGVTGRPGD